MRHILRHEGLDGRDHIQPSGSGGRWKLHGEIFICVDDAVDSGAADLGHVAIGSCPLSRARVLHLEGYDDTSPGPRRAMKRRENKLLKELSRRFDLGKLGRLKQSLDPMNENSFFKQWRANFFAGLAVVLPPSSRWRCRLDFSQSSPT